MLTQLQTIYTDYAATVIEVRKKARAFDGLFGMGKDPRKDPCHEAFYYAVEDWVKTFVESAPAQEDVMAAAMFILETADVYKYQECYWFMYAAQSHMKLLVPLVSQENCAVLAGRLESLYKKRDRMPLQNELLKMLKKAAK